MSRALIIFVFPVSAMAAGCVGALWASAGGVPSLLGIREKSIEDIVRATVEKRTKDGRHANGADLSDAGTIRILLLGLDARKEDLAPHCDAIHLFSIDTKHWTVAITSVPRGTYAYIPKDRLPWEKLDKAAAAKKIEDARKPPPLAATEPTLLPVPPTEPLPDLTPAERNVLVERAFISQESYLANACAFMGLDYGVEKIEGVLGIKADYRVTVGFAQTMGVLRLLGLPATEGLQWLRHRQSYAIGEPQRSHNQAVFMKDLLLMHVNRFKDPITIPLARVFYSLLETDMDFDTAYALVQAFIKSDLSKHPERITLSMRPAYPTTDYHFDPAHPLADLKGFYANLAPRLDSFSGATLETIQDDLIAYLDGRLASAAPTDDLMDKEIWMQVEDEAERERVHFALVERTTHELADAGDLDGAIDLATAYVVEKETLGLDLSAQKGRTLLGELIRAREAEATAQ